MQSHDVSNGRLEETCQSFVVGEMVTKIDEGKQSMSLWVPQPPRPFLDESQTWSATVHVEDLGITNTIFRFNERWSITEKQQIRFLMRTSPHTNWDRVLAVPNTLPSASSSSFSLRLDSKSKSDIILAKRTDMQIIHQLMGQKKVGLGLSISRICIIACLDTRVRSFEQLWRSSTCCLPDCLTSYQLKSQWQKRVSVEVGWGSGGGAAVASQYFQQLFPSATTELCVDLWRVRWIWIRDKHQMRWVDFW